MFGFFSFLFGMNLLFFIGISLLILITILLCSLTMFFFKCLSSTCILLFPIVLFGFMFILILKLIIEFTFLLQ